MNTKQKLGPGAPLLVPCALDRVNPALLQAIGELDEVFSVEPLEAKPMLRVVLVCGVQDHRRTWNAVRALIDATASVPTA